MAEENSKQTPTYFEVIDLIEKIFPPKSVIDYTKLSPAELTEIFNEHVRKSGYFFEEKSLDACRNTIAEIQRFNYDRRSNFLGGGAIEDNGFDQNNYSIQNRLSEMKNRVIMTLTESKKLLSPMDVYSFSMERIMEFRDRTATDKIEKYVMEVLSVSWEPEDTVRPETSTLAIEILHHFGVNPGPKYDDVELLNKVIQAINRLEFGSRQFIGPMDREGYYDRSTTDDNKYTELLRQVSSTIAGLIHEAARKTLDKGEKFHLGAKEERENITKPKEKQEPVVTATASKEPVEEVSLEELEATKNKYELVQEIAAENIDLSNQLVELRKQAAELEARIKANKDKITKILK